MPGCSLGCCWVPTPQQGDGSWHLGRDHNRIEKGEQSHSSNFWRTQKTGQEQRDPEEPWGREEPHPKIRHVVATPIHIHLSQGCLPTPIFGKNWPHTAQSSSKECLDTYGSLSSTSMHLQGLPSVAQCCRDVDNDSTMVLRKERRCSVRLGAAQVLSCKSSGTRAGLALPALHC